MSQDILKIRCPYCGAVLSVKNQPGIETKNVTCPICKQKSPFTAFKAVNMNADPGTDLPNKGHGGNATGSDATQLDPNGAQHTSSKAQGLMIGSLIVVATGQTFNLRPGRNVVGRKAQASSADFQIDTAGGKRMSREHLIVDVARVGNDFMHTAKLYKERVNDTFINDSRLCYGDTIVLQRGDIIHLPDADVKFDINDSEGTDY